MAKKKPEIDTDDALRRMHAGESIRSIAKSINVAYSTLRETLEACGDQYARAREAQADAHADEVIEVAKQAVAGDVDTQAARLLVDALKWRAAKFYPKVYGEKQQVEHGGRVQLDVTYDDTDD